MTVADYDLHHGAAFHASIAAFVAEVIAAEPEEGFTGAFGYRIDVYRDDGTAMPFIYRPD